MNSIVERLRLYKPIDNTSTLINEAADLIEQQAERIKELEAELKIADERGDENWKRAVDAEEQLAALRQRIDDAPIIKYEWVGDGMKPLINREDLQK